MGGRRHGIIPPALSHRNARHALCQADIDLFSLRLDFGPDQLQYLTLFRVPPGGFLGENQIPVHLDFEHAALRGDQLDGRDPRFYFFQQIGRETHGAGGVVSNSAIFDADSEHDCLPGVRPPPHTETGEQIIAPLGCDRLPA